MKPNLWYLLSGEEQCHFLCCQLVCSSHGQRLHPPGFFSWGRKHLFDSRVFFHGTFLAPFFCSCHEVQEGLRETLLPQVRHLCRDSGLLWPPRCFRSVWDANQGVNCETYQGATARCSDVILALVLVSDQSDYPGESIFLCRNICYNINFS